MEPPVPVRSQKNVHAGLAACIVGPTGGLFRREVRDGLRHHLLAPAARQLGSSDAFFAVKLRFSLADLSAEEFLNNMNPVGDGDLITNVLPTITRPSSPMRTAIIHAERASMLALASELNATEEQVDFIDFDYRRLSTLQSGCPSPPLDMAAFQNQRVVTIMAFDNARCLRLMLRKERRRGYKYAIVARIRPDEQFCKPLPPLEGLLLPGAKVLYAGHTDHLNFMPRSYAEHYFSAARVNATMARCMPPTLSVGYRPATDVQWCVPGGKPGWTSDVDGTPECLLEHYVESSGWR